MKQDPFKEYLKQLEPSKKEKAAAWNTAIGLQAVDGLTPSKYLIDTAIQNIEGNTRTTAVFLIKYLRMLGFEVTNDLFAEHSWYFRNALVRANYTNINENIYETTSYLEDFFRNLLLNEQKELLNRNLHVKVYIEEEEVYIQEEKVYIHLSELVDKNSINISNKTVLNIRNMYNRFGSDIIFGRSDVMELLGVQASGGTKLIKKMLEMGIIQPVAGYGKGKYRFKNNFSF